MINEENFQQEMALHVKIMKDNIPAILAKIAIDAKLHRVKFLALKKEGFSDSESLELCKSVL